MVPSIFLFEQTKRIFFTATFYLILFEITRYIYGTTHWPQIIENIWFDYKKKKFVPLKNKLSWRGVFTAGFYVSLIVALKRIKGRKLELKNPLRFNLCLFVYTTTHRGNVDKSNHFSVF